MRAHGSGSGGKSQAPTRGSGGLMLPTWKGLPIAQPLPEGAPTSPIASVRGFARWIEHLREMCACAKNVR